ncbi:MAG: cohesin domain-containing protein [Candidatus Shapirobacteria bacterium]
MKENSKIIILSLLIISLAVAVSLVQKIQETRRGAAGEGLAVAILPSSENLETGDKIITYLDVAQPEGKYISTFALKINYDKQKLKLLTSSSGQAAGSDNILLSAFSASAQGQISIIGGTNSLISGSTRVIKLEFEALASGEATVSLNTSGSYITACGVSDNSCAPNSEITITDFFAPSATYKIGEIGGERPEISLYLSPSSSEKKINEQFPVIIRANSGNHKISGVELVFTYNPTLLEVVSIDLPVGSDQPFDSALTKEINNGQVRIVATASRTDNSLLASGSFDIATLNIKGKQLGSANFSLQAADFSGVSVAGNNLDNEIVLPVSLAGEYSIVQEPTSSCSDSDGGYAPFVSGTVTTDEGIFSDYCQNSEALVEYYCYGSPAQAESDTENCSEAYSGGLGACSNGACVELSPTVTPTLPESCTVEGETGYCEEINNSCEQGTAGRTGENICLGRGKCCIEQEANTPISIGLKVKFDGVNHQIPDQKILLTVKKAGIGNEPRYVEMESNESGILSGQVSLTDVAPGAGYYLIIKGPKHVAERFCIDGQESRCSSGQTLTLGQENDFDFSGWALPAGDIANGQGRLIQDGIVDSADFNVLLNALASKDPDIRAQANLSYNIYEGEENVTTRDINLYFATLKVRYDDDY